MSRFLFYATVVLLMPYLTVLLVHHSVGGMASFVGFGAALACLALATVLAQTTYIILGLLRIVRKLAGSKDVEAPPTMAEKLLLASGPVAVSVFIYGATGAVLSYWSQINPLLFISLMLLLGVAYAGLMVYGVFRQLADLHDLGPI